MPTKTLSDKLNLDQLAELFMLPDFERIAEMNSDNTYTESMYAYNEAIKDGDSEDAAEEKQIEAQQDAESELYRKWAGGVLHAAETLFGKHGLELTAIKAKNAKRGDVSFEYKIHPTKSWDAAAEQIRVTIDGVGSIYVGINLHEFLDSGPWTARQAVLEHLRWMSQYPSVYGSTSAHRLYESGF